MYTNKEIVLFYIDEGKEAQSPNKSYKATCPCDVRVVDSLSKDKGQLLPRNIQQMSWSALPMSSTYLLVRCLLQG